MNITKLVSKNLLRRPGRFVFTLLGITIGMAAFVALLSMGNNLRAEVSQQADDLGAHLIVTSRTNCPFVLQSLLIGDQVPEDIPIRVVNEIAAIDGITSVIPHLTLGTSINNELVSLVGVFPAEMKTHRDWVIEDGRYFNYDERAVVIGSTIAMRFGLNIGDQLTFRGDDFPVAAILQPTGSGDDNTVFMPLALVWEVYELGEYVSFIAVNVDNVTRMEYYKAAILDIANVSVMTDDELLGSVLVILGSVNATLQIIALIALFAAAFGIINTMMTAIHERRREIGILRAMGSKSGTIFKIFMLESGLYGLLGGLSGLGVGFVISRIAAPLIAQSEFVAVLGNPDFAVTLTTSVVFTVLGLSMSIAIISGLYPAWKASKLTPMEAIRNV